MTESAQPPPRRVLLSHTSELRLHPVPRSFVRAAEEAVAATGDAVMDMAYFAVRDTLPADACRNEVRTADVYVLIAGHRYGSVVPGVDPAVSYTELEFDTATAAGTPRLVFLIADDASGPASMFIDNEHGTRQVAFRAKARSAGISGVVDSPGELKAQLISALSRLPRSRRAGPTPETGTRPAPVGSTRPVATEDSRRPRGRTAPLIGSAVALAAVAAVAATVWVSTGRGSAAPGHSGTDTTVTAVPTTTSLSAAPDLGAAFSDDFSSAALDLDRWRTPDRPDHIRQEGGRLVLSTRPGDGVDYTNLEPQDQPGTFTDIRFSVVVPPFDVAGDGGGALVLNPRGQQPQLLALGPGNNGGVVVAPMACDRPSCDLAVYEDFTRPDFTRLPDIQPGDVVDVEIRHENAHLVYLLNGQEVGTTTIDPGPLTEFWFSVTAGSEESWDVQIDDLVVS